MKGLVDQKTTPQNDWSNHLPDIEVQELLKSKVLPLDAFVKCLRQASPVTVAELLAGFISTFISIHLSSSSGPQSNMCAFMHKITPYLLSTSCRNYNYLSNPFLPPGC